MLDHAIYMESDYRGVAIVETNHGLLLKARRWPQDCESQLVFYEASKKECSVIHADALARNIKLALETIKASGVLKGENPAWYRELSICANGVE